MKKLDAGYNRVIVKEMEPDKSTKGGLIIPDTATEKPNKGEVISAGPMLNQNNETTPPLAEVGDVVYYGKYAGTELEFDGNKYKSIEIKDIIAFETDEN